MALVESGESATASVAPQDRARLARAMEWLISREAAVRERMTGEVLDAYAERGVILALQARNEQHTVSDTRYRQNAKGVDDFGIKLQGGALIFFMFHRIGLEGMSLQEQLLETESGWTALGAVLFPFVAKGALMGIRETQKHFADNQALTRVARTLSRSSD